MGCIWFTAKIDIRGVECPNMHPFLDKAIIVLNFLILVNKRKELDDLFMGVAWVSESCFV